MSTLAEMESLFERMPPRHRAIWRETFKLSLPLLGDHGEAALRAWKAVGWARSPGGELLTRKSLAKFRETRSDEFREADHPRAEDGKFTDGGGSTSTSSPKPAEAKASAPKPARVRPPRVKAVSGKAGASQTKANLANGGLGLTAGQRQAVIDVKSGREPLASDLAEAKKILGGDLRSADVVLVPDTEKLHAPGGAWSDERKAMHKDYAAERIDGVRRSDTPTVIMTGGGPAAGKSTGILSNKDIGIPSHGEAAHIDPDDAKDFIPEYRAGVEAGDLGAASAVHEESSKMAKDATRHALGSGASVVLDAVGDSGIEKLHRKVTEMRAAGAKRVEAHYATIDVDTAWERALSRAKRTGRFVPEVEVRRAHEDVNRTVWAAAQRGTFDAVTVYDTTDKEPVKVWSYTREGGLTVHDKAAFKRFRARAGVEE